MDRALVLNNVKTLTRGNLGIPIMLMGLLGMMILPMPAFLLDVFFTFNITLSIVILLVCVYALLRGERPFHAGCHARQADGD